MSAPNCPLRWPRATIYYKLSLAPLAFLLPVALALSPGRSSNAAAAATTSAQQRHSNDSPLLLSSLLSNVFYCQFCLFKSQSLSSATVAHTKRQTVALECAPGATSAQLRQTWRRLVAHPVGRLLLLSPLLLLLLLLLLVPLLSLAQPSASLQPERWRIFHFARP